MRGGAAFDPSIEARVVIGADGVRSDVRKWLGLPEVERGAAIEVEIPVGGAGGRLKFDFGGVRDGYAWTFPKSKCLSAGMLSYAPKDLRRDFESYLEREGLSERARGVERHGAEIPRGGASGPFHHGERGLVVGDAAGLVDPLTGEGIYYAVWSAAIAADVVATGAPLAQYTARVEREIVSELRIARRLADGFHKWPRLAYALGVRSRRANDALMDAATGRGSYADVRAKFDSLWAAKVFRLILKA